MNLAIKFHTHNKKKAAKKPVMKTGQRDYEDKESPWCFG